MPHYDYGAVFCRVVNWIHGILYYRSKKFEFIITNYFAEFFLDFFFENIFLIIIAFVSGGLLIWPLLSGYVGLKKLGTAEVTTLLNRHNAVLLDLREEDQLSLGLIPQAQRLPSSVLLKKTENFDQLKKKFQDKKNKNKPIILMSNNKADSLAAVGKFLKENGFEEVFCLDGGVEGWIDAGLPVKLNVK